MKGKSFLLTLGIVLIVIVGAYSGYQVWNKSSLDVELKRIENSFADYKKEMLQFENKNVMEAVAAKTTVKELKDNSIEWSKVIKEIMDTVPKSKDAPTVNILSYSGSGSSNISMNAKTLVKSENLYADVANFIESFDESGNFVENFVSSISAGKDDKGEGVLTFTFSTNYAAAPENIAPGGNAPEESSVLR